MHHSRSTTSYTPAMATCYGRTLRARWMGKHTSPMAAQAMCGVRTTRNTTSDILLLQTGVMASVSLFALLIPLNTLLLPNLISLSGLTGLSLSLVGLIKGLSPGTKTGD